MKVEKFKILQYLREFLIMIDTDMDNFPKKDIELKHKIRMSSYEILEMAYEANILDDIQEKKKLLKKIIAKIKVIDFLLNLSHDKMIINEKRYYKFGNKLDDILKYISGWLKTMGCG